MDDNVPKMDETVVDLDSEENDGSEKVGDERVVDTPKGDESKEVKDSDDEVIGSLIKKKIETVDVPQAAQVETEKGGDKCKTG